MLAVVLGADCRGTFLYFLLYAEALAVFKSARDSLSATVSPGLLDVRLLRHPRSSRAYPVRSRHPGCRQCHPCASWRRTTPGARRLGPNGVIEYLTVRSDLRGEQIMADASVQHPAPSPATVADIMHSPVTTVNQNDHVAAAAYLMERADGTALIITQGQTGEPIGIITDADISHAVADGKNPSDVRIYQLMTARPTVISTTASIRDAAKAMTTGHFRHLPVMGDAGLVGIVDITDVLRALLDVSEAGAEEPSSDP